MSDARATDATRKLTESGDPLDYGSDLQHLLVWIMRELAQGRPVPKERVDRVIADLGIARNGAYRFQAEGAWRPGARLLSKHEAYDVGSRLATEVLSEAEQQERTERS